MPDLRPASHPRSLRAASLLLVLLALVPVGSSLAGKRQLFALGGLTDNWIYLGANLRVAGVLGEDRLPIVLRAPGYPLFLAGLFAAALEQPPGVTPDYMTRGGEVVYVAQALLLVASGLLLFRWLARLVPRPIAFAAGLLLATSPGTLVLVGLVHYSVLHLFLLVAGGYALDRVLASESPSRRALAAAGLVWGLATIVRSTTLILPAFVLGLFVLRWGARAKALRATLLFTAAMAVVIAPVTLRNYLVSGRLVVVNHQAGAGVWGSSVRLLPADPDVYRWYEVSDDFMRVFARVTGQDRYDYAAFARDAVPLVDELGREARQNLARDPWPYLGNALWTLKTLALDDSSILIRVFGYSQPPRPWVDAFWFRDGTPREFLPVAPARDVVRLGAVLTGLAVVGVVAAVARRDVRALSPALIFACLALAHALTYMDVLYYYLRPPFVAFLAFYGVAALSSLAPERLRPQAARAAQAVAVALCAASLYLTARLLAG